MLKVQTLSPVAGFDSSFATSLSTQSKMPVDFASYLLSASPPGFELHYSLRDQFGFNPHGFVGRRDNPRNTPLKPIIITQSHGKTGQGGEEEESDDDDCPPTPPSSPDALCSWMPNDALDLEEEANCNSSNNIKSKSPPLSPSIRSNNGGGLKKKVSFADESGLALVAVRLLTESSDMPPKIRPEILSSLTQGASAGVTETPPLVLNFAQPASDYMAFREKVERNCVSLENVILKDYSLIGTVKVKNIAFEKNVKLRVTFDSWDTHVDVPASYVPNGETGVPYDTFSFAISVPPNMDVRKKVQFVVLFEANGQQFWDNNNEENYEVVSADWNASSDSKRSNSNTTDAVVFGLYSEEKWTEFSGWRNMDSSVPYY